METIRILIADDHPLVRCGIRETLRVADDMTIAGEASRGDEAQRLCRELQPDVLLLDLQMPGATATETIECVQEACPATRIIILTAYDDEVYVRGMVALGVAGYVLKDEWGEVITIAIRSVMQGGTWFSRRVLNTLATGQLTSPINAEEPVLSESERQLLQCLMRGMKDKTIARLMHRSEGTVRNDLSKLYAALDVNGRLQAAAWGWQHGYGTPE